MLSGLKVGKVGPKLDPWNVLVWKHGEGAPWGEEFSVNPFLTHLRPPLGIFRSLMHKALAG